MPTVNFIEDLPPSQLAEYVDAFWHCRITRPGTIRLLPTACSEIMVYRNWHDNGLAFIGPMGISQTTQVRPGDVYIGARLKPGTYALFQKQSYQSLRDSKLHDYQIAHPLIRAFSANFPLLDTPAEVKERLVDLVTTLIDRQLLLRDPLVDRFIAFVESTGDAITVEAATKNLPISLRQFRRRFAQYTGFSPKEFLRLCRQQPALADLKQMNTTVTEIAAKYGYADHAHFTHEFRRLIGVTPILFERELTLK